MSQGMRAKFGVVGLIMTQPVKGAIAMLLACLTWGFAPLYYSFLSHLGPEEILSHRTRCGP